MQSLLSQTASNPYHSICYAGWKKRKLKNLFLQETEIKEQKKNKEAQLSLKRHSVSKGTWSQEKEKNIGAQLEEVALNMGVPHGFDSPLSTRCIQISLLEYQHHCMEFMAETGECCFLKVIAHYHSWLQQ